jgi:hypothetical protein
MRRIPKGGATRPGKASLRTLSNNGVDFAPATRNGSGCAQTVKNRAGEPMMINT